MLLTRKTFLQRLLSPKNNNTYLQQQHEPKQNKAKQVEFNNWTQSANKISQKAAQPMLKCSERWPEQEMSQVWGLI